MKKIKKFCYFLLSISMTSCVTAHKMNDLSYGMTKKEVIEKMGRPISTSANGPVEFLNYKLTENVDAAFWGWYTDYFVKLVDGKVVTYGKLGDFDSTKDPTINVNTNSKIESVSSTKENSTSKMYEELIKLKDLLDSGIITQEEYEKKKKEILEKY